MDIGYDNGKINILNNENNRTFKTKEHSSTHFDKS